MPNEFAILLPYAVPLGFAPYSTQYQDWDYRAYITYNRAVSLSESTFSFETIAGATYQITSTSFFDPNLILFDGDGDHIPRATHGSYGTDTIFVSQTYIAEDLYVWAGWDQGFSSAHQYVTFEILVDVDTINEDRTIFGSNNSDELVGGMGDDTILGLLGDDSIDGNGGLDTARYGGTSANHTLILNSSNVEILDRRADGNGTDVLTNIELLDFGRLNDREIFDLRDVVGASRLSEGELHTLTELYIAYFNRAPDALGLFFWATAFADGTTLEQMATLFVDQDETRTTYPNGTSNSEFATSVYNNVLGRTPDQAGISFWVSALDSNAVSRDQFILEVLRGAKSELKPEEGQEFVDQQAADRTYLENKVDIGAYFSIHRGMSDVDNASVAMAIYDGTQSGIDQAVIAIDNYYEQALDPITGDFLIQMVGVLDNPFNIA